MQIIGKCLSVQEFKEYCTKKKFSPNNPDKLVLHHTWKPDVKDWNGSKTIAGLKKHYESLGWSNGPHLFISEDGIWLFTDMKTQGIHAGTGNTRSIGIEVVGDYDGKVWKGKTKENAIGAILILSDKLKLNIDDIHPHNEYNKSKTCPGKMITKKWLRDKIATAKQASIPTPEPVKVPKPIQTPPEPVKPVTPQILKPESVPEVSSVSIPEKSPTPDLVAEPVIQITLDELPEKSPTPDLVSQIIKIVTNFLKFIKLWNSGKKD